MKKILTILMLTATVISVQAQDKKPASPKSTVEGTIDGVHISITYHQPSARGRKIMNGLVPYGKVWRTGANDATSITFSKDVNIEGKYLKSGTYALFTIPNENEWVIIFNSKVKQWGAYEYKEAEDVLRVTVEPMETDMVETFTIEVGDDSIVLSWEQTSVSFEVSE